MDTRIEKLTPPHAGQVDIQVNISVTVNISAFAARQKVNGFLVDEISLQMHGDEPGLVVGDRLTWRVPIILSMPARGNLGTVGEIDVDVQTGEVLYTRPQLLEIKQRARELAARPAPQTA